MFIIIVIYYSLVLSIISRFEFINRVSFESGFSGASNKKVKLPNSSVFCNHVSVYSLFCIEYFILYYVYKELDGFFPVTLFPTFDKALHLDRSVASILTSLHVDQL